MASWLPGAPPTKPALRELASGSDMLPLARSEDAPFAADGRWSSPEAAESPPAAALLPDDELAVSAAADAGGCGAAAGSRCAACCAGTGSLRNFAGSRSWSGSSSANGGGWLLCIEPADTESVLLGGAPLGG
jgi:hypothetical protein